jgi:class 3 adenylate cyclase
MLTKPHTEPPGGNSLLGIDLAGTAEDPLASRARASLASRVTSLLIGLITIGIGGVLIAKDWSNILGIALIGAGLIRFAVIYLAKERRGPAFVIHNLTGAAIFALALLEVGSAAGIDVWGVLAVGIPPLTMARQEGRPRRVVYAMCIGIVAVAEIAAQILPPRRALPADVLAQWRLVNFVGAAIVLAALTLVYRKTLAHAEQQVAEQQKVSERLLTNILPAPIAERLKRDEYPIADAHNAATIMFADGVSFSAFAAQNPAETVVALLNRIVYAFDDMALRRGVEKIKTIGDAYMVAGGLTGDAGGTATAAAAVADLAFEMLDFIRDLRHSEGLNIDLRIGIHTGPLVAGVIGKHKFSYDVWGETVNTAAHLESAGEPGCVHISEATALVLGPGWRLEPRGLIALKGRGTISSHFLLGRTASLATAAK